MKSHSSFRIEIGDFRNKMDIFESKLAIFEINGYFRNEIGILLSLENVILVQNGNFRLFNERYSFFISFHKICLRGKRYFRHLPRQK